MWTCGWCTYLYSESVQNPTDGGRLMHTNLPVLELVALKRVWPLCLHPCLWGSCICRDVRLSGRLVSQASSPMLRSSSSGGRQCLQLDRCLPQSLRHAGDGNEKTLKFPDHSQAMNTLKIHKYLSFQIRFCIMSIKNEQNFILE